MLFYKEKIFLTAGRKLNDDGFSRDPRLTYCEVYFINVMGREEGGRNRGNLF